MKLSILHEPNLRSMAERYRLKDASATRLFGSHPAEEEDWRRRAAWLDETAGDRADRSGLVDALRHYQSQLPIHAEAERSLERLADPRSLVIVGGQQAGLFGGALLIYYKALTVIQAARHAERLLGRPVVPVFWIAGEDHDFDEANHVHVEAADGGVRRIRIERPSGARLAVSRTPLSSADWEAALRDIGDSLPDTAFKPQILRLLREQTMDSPSLSLAFARLLATWFGQDGLVLLDADDAALRKLESPMFRALVTRNAELEAALREGERAVAEAGFPLQAETAPGSANLFLHHDQGRLLLYRDGERYTDRRGFAKLEPEELLATAEQTPEMLSTNALSRPLMQDYVLPVLAAVLGPSELAYWGVLGPAFRTFGMSMPLLLPRQSFTYVEPAIEKLLEKYGLTPEEALTQWQQRRDTWLAAQDEWDLEGQFRSAREQFRAMYAPVVETVSGLHAGMAELSEQNLARIVAQIDYLEKRAVEALAQRHGAALGQWDRIRSSLCPSGKPQERIIGTLALWNRYGPQWLQSWRDVPYDATGGHRLARE